MIKTKEGTTKIEGTLSEVRADFIVIVKSYKSALMKTGLSEEEADDAINEGVEFGLMTEDEALKKRDENEKKFKEKRKELVKEFLEELFGVKEEEADE